jgi:hypothetical protein
MKKIVAVTFVIILLVSCKKDVNTPAELSFAQKVENAHQKDSFNKEEIIQFDLKLSFGGQERVNGKMTLATDSSKGKITFVDGNVIIFDGSKVFYSPKLESTTVRFNAYTWSYFFMFPYKLSDPGTQWQSYVNKEKDSSSFYTEKLTFKPQTGDAPDDWYIVYADKKSNLIQKAAYIVTAYGSKEEAEKNPHAIQYSDYKTINSMPIATKWKFWGWNTQDGLTDQLGEATLTNIEFLKYSEDLFFVSKELKTSNP